MAALPVLTRDRRNGSVFVEDRRADGTVVVLRCASEVEEPGGVAAHSHEPETIWPMEMIEESRAQGEGNRLLASDFALVVDTTELPEGVLVFDVGRFVEHVQQVVEAGDERIMLDPKRAGEWGLISKEGSLG
jgi:hypothetical protein